MQAAVITQQGSPVTPNVRCVGDWPTPAPGPGDLLIRTEASALNHLDLWVGRGVPGAKLLYPRVSGSDGVGIVAAVGPGVTDAWLGKRVYMNAAVLQPQPANPGYDPPLPAMHVIGEHAQGANAAHFLAPAANCLDLRETDPLEAAAFGLSHLTAWTMMRTRARLRAGQSVLITGIGGGVALAALNIAKHFACTTIVTSRHQHKLERASQLGAHHTILDTGDDWSRAVRDLTSRRGVDLVVDSVGKAIHPPCIRSLARGGTFVSCGCTTGSDATTDLARIFWNQLAILGSTMGSMDDFREITALLTSGAIRPVIDSVFDAEDAPRAFARLESGEHFGKIVIRWN